jgi:hypothetical protein
MRGRERFMKYTKADIVGTSHSTVNYISASGSAIMTRPMMVTFRNGEKCSAYSAEDAVAWMNMNRPWTTKIYDAFIDWLFPTGYEDNDGFHRGEKP